jgi:hypothetical protein
VPAGRPLSEWLTSLEAFVHAITMTARSVNRLTHCANLASAVKGKEEGK